MKKIYLKFIALMLVVLILLPNLTMAVLDNSSNEPIYYTFFDIEKSENNIYLAGILDFYLQANDFSLVKNSTNEAVVSKQIEMVKNGGMNFQYNVKSDLFFGDIDDFCYDLHLKASLNGDEVYNSSLVGFNYFTEEIGTWNFEVTMSTEADKTCGFNFEFLGWELGRDIDQSFFDKEIALNEILSNNWGLSAGVGQNSERKVVLNEFLPNPSGQDSAQKPDGEWVEIYNLTDKVVQLADYYLEDASGHRINIEQCRTNTGGTAINPNNFLVIYRKGGTGCNSNGFSLNNDGDTIYLYDNDDWLIDSYTYIDEVPENKSFARIPDGIGNWVDPIPTPGEPNKLDEEYFVLDNNGSNFFEEEQFFVEDKEDIEEENEDNEEEPGEIIIGGENIVDEQNNDEISENEIIEEDSEEENQEEDTNVEEDSEGIISEEQTGNEEDNIDEEYVEGVEGEQTVDEEENISNEDMGENQEEEQEEGVVGEQDNEEINDDEEIEENNIEEVQENFEEKQDIDEKVAVIVEDTQVIGDEEDNIDEEYVEETEEEQEEIFTEEENIIDDQDDEEDKKIEDIEDDVVEEGVIDDNFDE